MSKHLEILHYPYSYSIFPRITKKLFSYKNAKVNHRINNSCIASIVKVREPLKYPNITGAIVEKTTGLNGYYIGSKSNINKTMQNNYLGSGHYSTYSSSSVTMQQYKNNCDANHLIIDVAYLGAKSNNHYHCVVTYGYIYI